MSQVSAVSSSRVTRGQPHRHRLPAKSPVLRERQEIRADTGRYVVYQWKDWLDADAPKWKKAFYWLVFRPFNHFCRFVLKMPTFNGEQDGRLCWLEFQGWVDERWQAEQTIDGRPNWGYSKLPVDAMLPSCTLVTATDHNYPGADLKTQERYQRNGKATVDVPKLDLVRLAGKISQTDPLVKNFHSKAT